MKKIILDLRTAVCISILIISFPDIIKAKNLLKEENSDYNAKRVLVIGLEDNVRSNYFYDKLIAEETGIEEEMIDQEYNSIIAENIASTSNKQNIKFITTPSKNNGLVGKIKISGEEEECSADISELPAEQLKETLEDADAEYLLVINQHYLKWEERPLRTLFHIVSYSLFDKNKKEIYHGNNYFTSMNLETPEKLRKTSRKSSSKIASAIIKSLKIN